MTDTNSNNHSKSSSEDKAPTDLQNNAQSQTAQNDNQKNSATDDKTNPQSPNTSSKNAGDNSNNGDKKSSDNKDNSADSAQDKDSGSNQTPASQKENNDKDSNSKATNDKKDDAKKDNDSDSEVSESEKKLLGVDIESILDKEEALKDKLKESSHLERFATDISLFISLIKDYYHGNYRKIPYKSISSIVIGLIYILNPIDIIPDFIPVIGYVDDALVIAFCLKMVEKDLRDYEAWKAQQDGDSSNKDANSKDSKNSEQKA